MAHRLCRICGDFHNLNDEWPAQCVGHFHDVGDAAFIVISDQTHTVSMLDGRTYDSKSELRKSYRAAGVREVGNDRQDPISKPNIDRRGLREGLRQAIQQHGF